MHPKRVGQPLPLQTEEALASEHGQAPGLGWEVSDDAREAIEEIEANRRDAEYHSIAVRIG